MKTGMKLPALVAEVTRRSSDTVKKDILAPTNALSVYTPQTGSDRSRTSLKLGEAGFMRINDYCHGQIAAHTGIPKAYYDRMRSEQLFLFDQNVNTWFRAAPATEQRFVRTLDGRVRAFLSDRYRPLDNEDLLTFLLPELFSYPDIVTESLDLTERRLYLKLSLPSLVRDVRPGDAVRMGVILQNSEVGAGAMSVLPFSVRQNETTTGMVHTDMGKRSHHVGKLLGDIEDIQEFISDETRKADDRAFFLKVRDVVRAVLSAQMLERIVQQMQIADGIKVEQPEAAIRVIAKQGAFTEDERNSVLARFIEGGSLTMLGLANAVADAASESDDYDRATELETFAGRLITLEPKEWKVITKAATAELVLA